MSFRKPNLVGILMAALVMLSGALIILWWLKFDQINLDSSRYTLSGIIAIETAIFSLTIAGLAFVSTVLSKQLAVLEGLKPRLLSILTETDDSVFAEIEEIYTSSATSTEGLPASLKYPKISHLTDAELLQYVPALIVYRNAERRGAGGTVKGEAHDLDADPMLLFRISCAVFLAEAWQARRNKDSIKEVSDTLTDMERAHKIVTLINNIYDSRLAARRGIPVFVFFTLSSIVLALFTMSMLSPTDFNKALFGVSLFPVVIVVALAGYYLTQILNRYF